MGAEHLEGAVVRNSRSTVRFAWDVPHSSEGVTILSTRDEFLHT